MKIKDMTAQEFKHWVSPSMVATVQMLENENDNKPLLDVMAQVLRLADEQIAQMMIERMLGVETLTPHGMYTAIFLLGVLCEREGWHLEEEIEI